MGLIRKNSKLLRHSGKLVKGLPRCVLHLKFEDNLTDSSGNGYTFTGVSAAYATGKFNKALSLTPNGYAWRADAAEKYKFTASGGVASPRTYMGWIKINETPPWESGYGAFTVFDDGRFYDNANGTGVALYVHFTDDKLKFSNNYKAEGGWVDVVESPSLIAGTWYHYAIVVDTDYTYMYLNGDLVDSAAHTTYKTSTWHFYIGVAYYWGPGTPDFVDYYNGLIDSFVVLNVALTAAGVAAYYNEETGHDEYPYV